MTVLRLVGLTIIVAAGVGALLWFAYVPLRCNALIVSAEHDTRSALTAEPWVQRARARRTLDLVTPCLKASPSQVDLWMLAGANLQILGRWEAAAAMYASGLKYDRRPELYLQLGRSLLQTGQTAAAVDALTQGVRFAPHVIREVADAQVRRAIYERLSGDERNYLINAGFEIAGASGLTRTRGEGFTGESAAADWMQWMTGAGLLATRIVNSTRAGSLGNQMLHVKTTTPDTGVFQEWPARSTSGRRVRSSAWVFVVSGRVKITSNGLPDGTPADARSVGTGRWENISGPSRCSPSVTSIFSDGGPAEFYIDAATVIDGGSC